MATIKYVLGIAFLTSTLFLHGQELDKAEVRIPYGELKQLLAQTKPAITKPSPKPALLSSRIKVSIENETPVLTAIFRTVSFGEEMALTPLIAGDVSLESQDPADTMIVIDKDSLCLATHRAGTNITQLRLLPVIGAHGFSWSLPPSPSILFETSGLPDDQSIILISDGVEKTLTSGQTHPLPNSGGTFSLRILNSKETREALRPPEPSTWTWQHQSLVIPDESSLIYQIITRASAADGSGLDALLPMPPDAQDITVGGDDLISHSKVRGENRSLSLSLTWKTRGILDRQLAISYRMPLRPLDPTWRLHSPGNEGTRTRFIIADSPLLSYAANGLTGPLTSKGLPFSLAEWLKGGTSHHLEASTQADLTVTSNPVAATAEGVVTNAEWSLKIEPDGAMLVTGLMGIEHKSSLDFVFDTPEGMKLLACAVENGPISPVDLGEGRLMVNLPSHGGKSSLSCSFTGSAKALDPVEGTLKLSLPKLPLFIHSLLWSVDLPSGYQAETHGNLKRIPTTTPGPPSRIALRKNLCRDERPEIHIFYQRSDLNR